MPGVIFYLLSEHNESLQHDPLEAFACQVAAHYYRQKQKLFIYCQDKAQAEKMDELLWQLPADAFVPHNLPGEGPENGTPVEINWQKPARMNRQVCINLQTTMPEFAGQFRTVIDFVPFDDARKQLARERYKHYRAAGFALDTRPAEKLNETPNG
ncbi:DNA polymerase III subunit chi [Planctobacterium marinum]|uniref:DNA polymerase III subunit chi n=1 Tax=Planctobacterium marinum TaxID=1631968 RepID=UPI001E4743B4|nr:DNA polymerase III subunit chi [Planctobacterium marinum]MCC2606819.1 DNA polymerase III subunit chi [Planctobacterium marinum]